MVDAEELVLDDVLVTLEVVEEMEVEEKRMVEEETEVEEIEVEETEVEEMEVEETRVVETEVLLRVNVLLSNKTKVLCAIEAGAIRTPARSSPKHNVTITLLTPLTDGTSHIICSNI